jgi:trehalose 6-phosphate synthase/phosphatase
MQPGLIIVSNRLPVSVKKVDGKLEFSPSIGGLATGLSFYAGNRRNKWIGWPGVASEEVNDDEKQQIIRELKKSNCYPVFLTRAQIDKFYNGYSNSVLWPVFHELAPNKDAMVDESMWRAYKRVNEAFADVVLSLSAAGSTVWIHDYQLLLLPALLRKDRPKDKIGFFLHIPFPGPKAFDTITHGKQLLGGMIGSDLIGFHTKAYVANFLENCQGLGFADPGANELVLPDRVVRVTDFPLGIDYGKYMRATKQRSIKREVFRLRNKYRGKKVILMFDRLDPTKGMIERLKAYQELLRQQPKLRGKVVLVMIAAPSRTEVAAYRNLKKRVEKLVAEITEEFSTRRWQAVDYQYRYYPFETVSAYYQLADIAFIAPVRDGMNLMAKEYIASRGNQDGVLVLSETAGAAQELQDAIQVNPKKTSSLVSGLTEALTLPPKELKQRVSKMQDQLSEFTAQKWAGSFMENLRTVPSVGNAVTRSLTPVRQREVRDAYRYAQRRLLLLDYDGVLVPLKSNPYNAAPSQRVRKLLEKLGKQERADVVVVSGRSKSDLSEWLGDLPVTLVAEHGAFSRKVGGRRWQSAHDFDTSWCDEVLPILEYYTSKTPGAAIETKDAAMVWHYRQASPYYAQKHLVILKRLLSRYARKYNLAINQGNMILEIRSAGATKGHVVDTWMETKPGFVLAFGDDYTDEDMFEALPSWAYTIRVGRGRTVARFRVDKPDDVIALLEKLAK